MSNQQTELTLPVQAVVDMLQASRNELVRLQKLFGGIPLPILSPGQRCNLHMQNGKIMALRGLLLKFPELKHLAEGAEGVVEIAMHERPPAIVVFQERDTVTIDRPVTIEGTSLGVGLQGYVLRVHPDNTYDVVFPPQLDKTQPVPGECLKLKHRPGVFQEHDVVEMSYSIQGTPLRQGMQGTVVSIHPGQLYVVEFPELADVFHVPGSYLLLVPSSDDPEYVAEESEHDPH